MAKRSSRPPSRNAKRIKSGSKGLALSFGMDTTNVEIAIAGFAERIKDFRRFWREFFAPQWFADIQQNFRSQGALVGGWRALSPKYAAWKRSQVGNKPILQFTGDMMRSFRIGDRENVFKVTTTYVELGSRMPRVAYHNRGSGRLPQRRILYTGPARVYKPLLDQFVAEEMRAAGMPNVRIA